MRFLAVGDIHGCFTALTTLAAFVPFQPEDTIVTVGDYVDRGPDARRVLDWLIDYRQRGKLVALRGNHEIMMLAARHEEGLLRRWLAYGGDATLASYSPFCDRGRLGDVLDSHWRFLEESICPWFETETHFFVHANAFHNLSLEEQPEWMLYWEPFGHPPPHDSGKVMICGHTLHKSGVPRNIGHAVCIDTWAYGDGWLTCLDVASGDYWQANQSGQTRKGILQHPAP